MTNFKDKLEKEEVTVNGMRYLLPIVLGVNFNPKIEYFSNLYEPHFMCMGVVVDASVQMKIEITIRSH